jgi:hypothetical protein
MSENYLDEDQEDQMEDEQVVEDELEEDQVVEEQSDDDDELEEYNDEYQNLLNFIRTHDYDNNLFQYSKENYLKIINEMADYMKTLIYEKNRIYLWEIYLQFLLFNPDFLNDRIKNSIVKKIDILSEEVDSLNIYRPFFDDSRDVIDFKNFSENDLYNLILDDKKYQQLSEVEIKMLEKVLMTINNLPEKIQDYLLDLSDDNREIFTDDTFFLDDEIEQGIHPKVFVPNPPDLDENSPQFVEQYLEWFLANEVIPDNYIPNDPEDELEMKEDFQEELIENITPSKRKLMSSDLRKLIANLDCNNLIDPITLEKISKKNYLELRWIIVLDETGKVGDCYDKEQLINSMLANVTFGTYPDRDSKYYKETFKGLWVDEDGIKKIPKSKIVQLKKVGEDKIGTRHGISRVHGVIENIYTLEKLY